MGREMTKTTRKLLQELHNKQPISVQKRGLSGICALKLKFDCCDGKGFNIITEGPYTRGEVCPCVQTCSACFGQTRVIKDGYASLCRSPSPNRICSILNNAKIPSRYGYATLKGFSNHPGNCIQRLGQIVEWLKSFDKSTSKGLVLEGPVGIGKTYIIAAIAHACARLGISVQFVDFFQLLSELKAGYSSNKADSDLIKPMIDVDVLIIDELGKGRNSDWEISVLDQLVMGRYNQNKPIIASTNYKMKNSDNIPLFKRQLDQPESSFREAQFEDSLEDRVGERIFSRLMETCHIIEMQGDNFRLKTSTNLEFRPL